MRPPNPYETGRRFFFVPPDVGVTVCWWMFDPFPVHAKALDIDYSVVDYVKNAKYVSNAPLSTRHSTEIFVCCLHFRQIIRLVSYPVPPVQPYPEMI